LVHDVSAWQRRYCPPFDHRYFDAYRDSFPGFIQVQDGCAVHKGISRCACFEGAHAMRPITRLGSTAAAIAVSAAVGAGIAPAVAAAAPRPATAANRTGGGWRT
jgi:hypothetical protein